MHFLNLKCQECPVPFSVHPLQRYMMPVCLITGDVDRDHLVRAVSVEMLEQGPSNNPFPSNLCPLILASICGSCLWHSKGDFLSVPHSLTYYCNSSVKDICPFNFYQCWLRDISFILWITVQYYHYFTVQIVPALAIGVSFRWAPKPFSHAIVRGQGREGVTSLLSGTGKRLQTYPGFSLPRSYNHPLFERGSGSFYWRRVGRKQGLHARWHSISLKGSLESKCDSSFGNENYRDRWGYMVAQYHPGHKTQKKFEPGHVLYSEPLQ